MKQIDVKSVANFWREPEALKELDGLLRQLRKNPADTVNESWIAKLRLGLGIGHSGLAEKLGVSRQAVLQWEQREVAGQLALEKLRQLAHQLDCDFVYGFVPKKHETFKEMIAHKALTLSQQPPPRQFPGQTQLYAHLASRVRDFLRRPTGWRIIWGLKKALAKKDYRWNSMDEYLPKSLWERNDNYFEK